MSLETQQFEAEIIIGLAGTIAVVSCCSDLVVADMTEHGIEEWPPLGESSAPKLPGRYVVAGSLDIDGPDETGFSDSEYSNIEWR